MATPKPIERTLTITNETEAFEQLKLALESQLKDDAMIVEFKKWPVITIRLEGKGYDSTITPHMAVALVDLQAAMNRTYAQVLRGTSNPNTLTNQQKQEIEFKAKVEKGSSLLTVDLGPYMSTLASGLVGKMDGSQMVMTVLGLAVVAGSTLAYKSFLKTRTEDRKVTADMQERVALSQEETKRLGVMQAVIAETLLVRRAAEDFDEARHSVTKSVADARTLTVQGVELSNVQAKAIAATPRSTAEEVQLNGQYTINKLDWTKSDEVRISISSTDNELDFTAKLNTETLTNEQVEMLKASEWGRQALYFQINATKLRGDITTATIMSVEGPKPAKPKT